MALKKGNGPGTAGAPSGDEPDAKDGKGRTARSGTGGKSKALSKTKPKASTRAGVVPRVAGAGRKDAAKAPLPPTRKGSRTRDKLKAAALRALEVNGYRSLRLTDIAREAKVNISLVYHYFQDKSDLVFEALRDVVSIRQVIEADESRPHEPFAALFYANKRFADFYKTRPGIVRSLVHFDEENPEFHALYAEVNHTWMERIAETMQKRSGGHTLTETEALSVAYALGNMVEKFLFDLYVDRNPKLAAAFPTTDDAARFLAILWYRALYLQNPATADLANFEKFSAFRLTTAS